MHRTRSGIGQSLQADAVLWGKGDRVVSGRREYKDSILSFQGVNRGFQGFQLSIASPRCPVDDE